MIRFFLFASIWVSALNACTAFLLRGKDGSVVYCRSMEYGFPLESEALILPRGTPFTGSAPDGPGFQWQTTYGIVGLNQNLDRRLFSDGMNEKGLVASSLYLPGFAECEVADRKKMNRTIGSWELPTVILSLCSTVAEVKKLLPTLLVAEQPVPGMQNFVLPLHFFVADRNGAVLIIEYIKGKLHMHDHPLGVLTNSPPLDFQMINLSNFVNLSPYNAPNLELRNCLVKGLGQGTGMLGLPGDWTPPSRFVRAALFASWAVMPVNAIDAVRLGFHMLNTFDIFYGLVQNKQSAAPPGKSTDDVTQWVVVHDMTNLSTFIRTYESLQIEKIDFRKIDFMKSSPIQIRLKKEFSPIDITDTHTPLPKDSSS